ncbi:Peroxin 11C [Penicillium capsulatum]|uniref:Peroxin 11C n=1 Tax=Penicillium capsulatum TaxID=69766 RepID=A0A9W9IUP6_9EURO|nr:Peroxin 11C [Penicillium capsulatum]
MADPGQPGNARTGRWRTTLSATDTTIRRINQILSTADGQESALSSVEYVASILHHLGQSAPWLVLQIRVLAKLKRRSACHPNREASNSSKCKSLSALVSETRCNLRLFGLLQLWTWGSETLRSPPADSLLYTLVMLQVISNVVYQILENVAYLASKRIASRRLVNRWGGIEKWYLWSTRGWFGHIFLEFLVLWRQRILRASHGRPATTVVIDSTITEETRLWRKRLVNNILWAPLCIHWCLEEGIGIPEYLTSVVSVLAGAWGLRNSWAETAGT